MMDLQSIRETCLSKKGTTEERPFGPDTIVFKVLGKMFALTADEPRPKSINLKCDPDHALALRAQYTAVRPGYHMNKRHWNTVEFDGSIPEDEILEMIEESYELAVAGLPKKEREWIRGQKC